MTTRRKAAMAIDPAADRKDDAATNEHAPPRDEREPTEGIDPQD
jgi:hypothetical protein